MAGGARYGAAVEPDDEREGGTGSAPHGPEYVPRPVAPAPPRPDYKPIALRAQILRWWLVASVGVIGTVIILNAIHLSILDADSFAGADAVVASDKRLAAANAAVMATFVVSAVLWLVWFHRAYRNLPSFEPISLRFGTGWAIGGWFVPIMNLFRPKQIANDIWRGTDPQPPQQHGAWVDRPVAPLVHWWWGMWLVASVLGNLSFRMIGDAQTLQAERSAVAFDIAASISYVVAGVLALLFVRAVTEREAARAAAVHGSETDAERVRTDQEGRSRRRPATVAFAVAGAAVLVLSVALAAGSLSDHERGPTGEVSETSAVSVFELRRGDCVNGLSETEALRAVEAVPCAQPHQAEVISSFRVEGSDFPGMKAIFSQAERRCSAALEAAAPPKRNGPTPFYLYPTRQSWGLGDRTIICVATYEVPVRGELASR
jgi:Domain of unknown function (DUF4328)/Septum formation